jgi:hypothetical protein
VLLREHPWLDGDQERFVDLVLSRLAARLVTECKRSKGGEWIFLVSPESAATNWARLCWAVVDGERSAAGWHRTSVLPAIHESSFCIVSGQSDEKPLLERVAFQTAAACDAIAAEEIAIARRASQVHRMRYVPTIVTTAEVLIARVDPKDIDLAKGTVDAAQFESADCVWFRKSLAARLTEGSEPKGIQESNADRERSVLIIASRVLPNVLKALTVADPFPQMGPPAS